MSVWGEELRLIVPDAPLEVIDSQTPRLRKGIEPLNILYRQEPRGSITLSMGVVSFAEQSQTPLRVIPSADVALYQSKAKGGDLVTLALL